MTMSQPDKHASGAMTRESATERLVVAAKAVAANLPEHKNVLPGHDYTVPHRFGRVPTGLLNREVTELHAALSAISAPEAQWEGNGPGFVSGTCEGERCSMCGAPAAAKVGEEIAYDDPMPHRHNLTAYVCAEHFAQIMNRRGYPRSEAQREGLAGRLAELSAKAAPGEWRVGPTQQEPHGIQSVLLMAGQGETKWGVGKVSLVDMRDADMQTANAELIVELVNAYRSGALALHAPSQPLPQEGGRVPDGKSVGERIGSPFYVEAICQRVIRVFSDVGKEVSLQGFGGRIGELALEQHRWEELRGKLAPVLEEAIGTAIDAAIDRLTAAPQPPLPSGAPDALAGWQKIETAPTNELVQAFEPHCQGGFQFVGIKNASGHWHNNLDNTRQFPTHWSHLRPSPAAIAQAEAGTSGTSEVEAAARKAALAKGHTNPDDLIRTIDGQHVPVWRFYVPSLPAPSPEPSRQGVEAMRPRIYTASKTVHAARWRDLRASGVNVISTWIDEAGVGETASFTDLWRRCVSEAADADFVLVYREPGEVLKGAFVEVGAALAAGKPVRAVGCDEFSFVNHAMVTCYPTLDAALAQPQGAGPSEDRIERLIREGKEWRDMYVAAADERDRLIIALAQLQGAPPSKGDQ